jgi:uncharacterized membrane protein SpoIIM required for sporulation
VISTHWFEKRKPCWNQLEKLLQRSEQSGLKSLARYDLQSLSLLYRQTAADLAAVREDPSSVEFARYLNQLLSRAHSTIYASRGTGFKSILTFFLRSYPQIFRENLIFCVTACALFLAGGVTGALLAWHSTDFQLSLLGPGMLETIERREMWTHSILAIKPLASSLIMTNNVSVSFMAFAAGITGGLGTLYMLFFNGMLMGVIGTACGTAGMSLKLWSFIAPHGVLELPAIFIAGGAGLRIAQGLLFPGVLPRKESLVRAGKRGVGLVVGVVPILVLAGVIEAFVSPTNLALPLKFAMAAGLFVLLLSYLFGFWNRSWEHIKADFFPSPPGRN